MKKKLIITLCFILCLVMMFFPWFHHNDIAINGFIMFENPIALTCIILFLIGIWSNFGMNSIILGYIGIIGLFVMELYEFMSWHVLTITGCYSLTYSFNAAYPAFYMALFLTGFTYLVFRYLRI